MASRKDINYYLSLVQYLINEFDDYRLDFKFIEPGIQFFKMYSSENLFEYFVYLYGKDLPGDVEESDKPVLERFIKKSIKQFMSTNVYPFSTKNTKNIGVKVKIYPDKDGDEITHTKNGNLGGYVKDLGIIIEIYFVEDYNKLRKTKLDTSTIDTLGKSMFGFDEEKSKDRIRFGTNPNDPSYWGGEVKLTSYYGNYRCPYDNFRYASYFDEIDISDVAYPNSELSPHAAVCKTNPDIVICWPYDGIDSAVLTTKKDFNKVIKHIRKHMND